MTKDDGLPALQWMRSSAYTYVLVKPDGDYDAAVYTPGHPGFDGRSGSYVLVTWVESERDWIHQGTYPTLEEAQAVGLVLVALGE